MKIDIVIPSHRNAVGLRRLLCSLARVDQSALQAVFIVFNPSDPALARELKKEFAPVLPLEILQLPAAGVNRARNAGLRAGSAELIFFIDDDEEVTDPELLNRHHAIHLANPQMMLLGGRYSLGHEADFWSQVYHSIQEDWFGTGFLMNGFHYQLLGGHLSAKRELFLKYQFEEKILFGGSETELLQRLQAAGVPSCGDSSLAILHHSQMGLGKFLRKAYRQGKGHSVFQFSDSSLIPRQVRPAHPGRSRLRIPIQFGRALYRLMFRLGRRRNILSFSQLGQSEAFVSGKKAIYRLFLFFEFLSDRRFEPESKISSETGEKSALSKKIY